MTPPLRVAESEHDDVSLPSARLVCDTNLRLLSDQHAHLNSLDLKASFEVAASGAALAGFLTALATHPPTHLLAYCLCIVAAVLFLGSIVAGFIVWWPRAIETVDPEGLHTHHFGDDEANVLEMLSSRAVTAWKKNKGVEDSKVLAIQSGAVMLVVGLLCGVSGFLLSV
ncbi:MAG TPA: hypothetical protein VFC09_13805 [Candidatus Dormibacteraeota bacterium]|nr:hypothetical protein [Candidatus Dormibacteraeota bacterium]